MQSVNAAKGEWLKCCHALRHSHVRLASFNMLLLLERSLLLARIGNKTFKTAAAQAR
jgi:hypothetical protein